VALIPHTLDATIAGGYKKGSVVNLEADVIARYVARNLRR
jgi:riboflavin synthase